MYRNNTSPWLQKHNAVALHIQGRQKYRMNWNVYSMLKMTLIIAVFILPSRFSFTFPPALTFSIFWIIQYLFSASLLLHPAFCCSQPTYTHSRACCDVEVKLHYFFFIPHLQVAKLETKERIGKEHTKRERTKTTWDRERIRDHKP